MRRDLSHLCPSCFASHGVGWTCHEISVFLSVILLGIRNIGFVHSPLMGVADGSESNSMIHITDWMPTFMHIARGQSVDGASLGIDGVDQFSAITTGAEARTVSLLCIGY